VGGHHTNGAPGLDFLDMLSQATGNAQSPDRESLRHAGLWKATTVLFPRHKVAHEEERKIMRNVASAAKLKRSSFAEIDKSRLTPQPKTDLLSGNARGDCLDEAFPFR
jgi:hypothetical protein